MHHLIICGKYATVTTVQTVLSLATEDNEIRCNVSAAITLTQGLGVGRGLGQGLTDITVLLKKKSHSPNNTCYGVKYLTQVRPSLLHRESFLYLKITLLSRKL